MKLLLILMLCFLVMMMFGIVRFRLVIFRILMKVEVSSCFRSGVLVLLVLIMIIWNLFMVMVFDSLNKKVRLFE